MKLKKNIILEKNNNIKYLIIGSKIKSKDVVSYNWEDIPKDLNLADFNKVIINQYDLNQNPDKLQYFKLENYNIYNLVFNSNAEIIVIGIPGHIHIDDGRTSYNNSWWLPVTPCYTICKGDTFKNIRDDFLNYFDLIGKYYFHFEDIIKFEMLTADKIKHIFKSINIYRNYYLNPIHKALAVNIYDKPLSLEIQYLICDGNQKVIKESGKIIWLPPPTKVEIHEAIIGLLRDRYQVILLQNEPDWAIRHKLPVQITTENEITTINEQIQELNNKKNNFNTRLQEQLFFRKLLYEKGEVLEEVVLKSLEILGAEIKELKEEKTEDGRIIDPYGRNYIIEIKGRNNQLKRKDIRQLDDWIKKAVLEEDWTGKGIIVGNYFNNKDITERKSLIHENEKNPLERFGFSVITTTQIYKSLQLFQEHKFQGKIFWDTIFNTNGLCTLPDL